MSRRRIGRSEIARRAVAGVDIDIPSAIVRFGDAERARFELASYGPEHVAAFDRYARDVWESAASEAAQWAQDLWSLSDPYRRLVVMLMVRELAFTLPVDRDDYMYALEHRAKQSTGK